MPPEINSSIVAAAALAPLAVAAWRWWLPACPRCQARRADRRLCRPLLLCRGCATRYDRHLRTYN